MKTTKEMEGILLGFGNKKEDMWQLKKAIRECNLTLTNKKTGEKRKIKNEEAVEILGMKTFLSGISRAAFHASASRRDFILYFRDFQRRATVSQSLDLWKHIPHPMRLFPSVLYLLQSGMVRIVSVLCCYESF